MTIPLESIEVGKCFATAANQVRRVLSVDEGLVDYEARGPKLRQGKWPLRYTVDIERFADDVTKEVPCHYDPDLGRPERL